MIERTIILPLKDNEGVSLRKVVNDIKREFLNMAGAYSEVAQKGVWRDIETGKVYRDESVRLFASVNEREDERIRAAIPRWCAMLRQVCLYTHAAPVEVEFIAAMPEMVRAS